MKRTILTASAAAGLIAVAFATPAWAQATTYPEGTDCSAISDSASRLDCTTQMNESRQVPTPGGDIQPGSPSEPATAAPDSNPAGNPSTNTPGGIDNSPPSNGTDGGTGTDGTSTN